MHHYCPQCEDEARQNGGGDYYNCLETYPCNTCKDVYCCHFMKSTDKHGEWLCWVCGSEKIKVFTKEIADAAGDIWDDKEHPCFICHRPTRYLDINWQGPICSNECDTWACNDAAYPKVEQGIQPHWKNCICPALPPTRKTLIPPPKP